MVVKRDFLLHEAAPARGGAEAGVARQSSVQIDHFAVGRDVRGDVEGKPEVGDQLVRVGRGAGGAGDRDSEGTRTG